MFTLRLLKGKWSVAGANFPANIFTAQLGFATHELTHILDSLVRVSRRGERNHVVTEQSMRGSSRSIRPPWGKLPYDCPCPPHDELMLIIRARGTTQSLLKAHCDITSRSRQALSRAAISPRFFGFLHFTPSRFRHYYLSLQSPVSPFPHGTSSLLVSNIYSTLDEIYHPLHAPIPRDMTLRRHTVH